MKVKMVILDTNAKVPEKAHPSDLGFDVYAVSEKQIAENVWQYGLGFGLQIERDWQIVGKVSDDKMEHDSATACLQLKDSLLDLSIDFRPRSSVWKTGMSLCNCVPTIDEGYTGEIKLNFYHVLPQMPRYRVGDKIAQCKVGMAIPMNIQVVEELDETDRGTDAFGSSDK